MNGSEESLPDSGRWISLLEFSSLASTSLEPSGLSSNSLKSIFLACSYTSLVIAAASVGGHFLKWMRNSKNLFLCKIYHCINYKTWRYSTKLKYDWEGSFDINAFTNLFTHYQTNIIGFPLNMNIYPICTSIRVMHTHSHTGTWTCITMHICIIY